MDTTSLRWRARVAKAAAAHSREQEESTTKMMRGADDDDDDDDDERVCATSAGSMIRNKCCCCCCYLCCGARSGNDCCRHTDAVCMNAVAATNVGVSMYILQSYREHNPISNTASLLSMLVAPYAAFQKRLLRRLGSIRRVHNQLRREMNYLRLENEALNRTLGRMDEQVFEMETVQRQLRRFANNETQLRRLVETVEEQAETNSKIKGALQRQVTQDLIQALFRADKNSDYSLNPQEMEALIVRLKAIDGVVFHERNFRAHMTVGDRSLSTILDLIRHLRAEDSDVFDIKPELMVPTAKLLELK